MLARDQAVAAPAKPKSRTSTRKAKLGFNERRELDALPDRIEKLEEREQELHQRLADPALYQGDGAKIAETRSQLTALEDELASAYVRWEELTELAEA